MNHHHHHHHRRHHNDNNNVEGSETLSTMRLGHCLSNTANLNLLHSSPRLKKARVRRVISARQVLCIYIYIYLFIYIFILYIYIYIHTCVCMYIYIYIHTHIHTHVLYIHALRGPRRCPRRRALTKKTS